MTISVLFLSSSLHLWSTCTYELVKSSNCVKTIPEMLDNIHKNYRGQKNVLPEGQSGQNWVNLATNGQIWQPWIYFYHEGGVASIYFFAVISAILNTCVKIPLGNRHCASVHTAHVIKRGGQRCMFNQRLHKFNIGIQYGEHEHKTAHQVPSPIHHAIWSQRSPLLCNRHGVDEEAISMQG